MSWTAASGAPPSAASAAASHKTRPSLSFNFGTSTVSAQHQQQHFSGDPYAVHSPALAAGGENEQHGRAAANSSIVGNGSSSRARTRSRPGSHQPQVSSSSSSSQHAGAAAAQQQQQYQQQHYHALRYTWDVWFSSRVPGQKQQQQQRSEHVVEQQQHHHQSEHDEVAAQAQAAAAPDHHHQQQQQQQQTGKNKATPTTAGGVPLVGNKEKETREEWEGAVERLGGFSTVRFVFSPLAMGVYLTRRCVHTARVALSFLELAVERFRHACLTRLCCYCCCCCCKWRGNNSRRRTTATAADVRPARVPCAHHAVLGRRGQLGRRALRRAPAQRARRPRV